MAAMRWARSAVAMSDSDDEKPEAEKAEATRRQRRRRMQLQDPAPMELHASVDSSRRCKQPSRNCSIAVVPRVVSWPQTGQLAPIVTFRLMEGRRPHALDSIDIWRSLIAGVFKDGHRLPRSAVSALCCKIVPRCIQTLNYCSSEGHLVGLRLAAQGSTTNLRGSKSAI